MTCKMADVAIDGATGSYDKKYGYIIPQHLLDKAQPGCRVTVPFGKGNLKKQAIILSVSESEQNIKYKEILDVTDSQPILNDEMLKMCEWMHENVFCTYFDAVHSMIPAGLNYKLTHFYSANEEFSSQALLDECEKEIYDFLCQKGEVSFKKLESAFDGASDILLSLEEKEAVIKSSVPIRRMGDKTSRWVRLKGEIDDSVKLTERQQEIATLIETTGSVSIKEIQYFTGCTISVIDSLEKKGIIECFEREEFRTPYKLRKIPKREEIILTDEQNKAYEGLKEEYLSSEPQVSLLYGITGSGKTQVFMKLVDFVSNMGRGVIVMVPEIALTPQIIERFSNRYGDKIAVFHSAMSLGQRMDEYKRIKQGKASIAIGTRSAIFAPFSDLGLIIIDEEQEHTYKSEKSPRFNARELAKFRTAYHGGLLCLASATPSMESYANALSGKYNLHTIAQRYGNAKLPQVSVVDMRKEILSGNSSNISAALATAISDELSQNKQIILLLNRRGHNTYISCPQCGWVANCPNCSISLTYHSANSRLMCHYCGHSEIKPTKCPECGGEHLSFYGAGTQKVEEELNLLFPNARILRLDADSTMTRDSYSVKLSAFAKGEYDIMLGTQMVAKGLDFPRVSLVGVIGADRALYSDDYRGFERTFSLLTQVVGRAGRTENEGRAIIQTVDPSSSVISLAETQDYVSFYNEEILSRKLMTYPPFCDICMVFSQSTEKNLALQGINEIFEAIKKNISGEYNDVKVIILGPCAAAVPKINGKYRYRMIIKCKNNKRFRQMLKNSTSIKMRRDLSIGIDMNPETVI